MKKGFTLIELLAVIVLLAVIIAIAIPTISGLMDGATRSTFESNAEMVIKAIDYKILEDSSFNPITVNEETVDDLLNLNNSNYETLTVKKVDNAIIATIIGKNKWGDLTAAGTKIEISISDTIINFVNGANAPVLASGMTPIKWSGSAWVDTTESDSAWYNYDTTNKQWANARTEDGSMWVWIPRFIYKISAANWHTGTAGTIDIQFTKGIDDNWNKTVIGNINLDESANASNDTWTNHPAFTFGGRELTGFWIAKFEASNTMDALNFVPNAPTRCCQSIGNMFSSSRDMEVNSRYGWGTSGSGIDTHLVKNTERGATAYLAQSVYGKNAEIWKNNSSTYITGCAGSSVSAAAYAGCEYAYNTANGQQASTTGNIYGIYDMSGGAWEYVAAYIDNGHSNLNTNGSSIINADIKYKSVYSIGATDAAANNFNTAINHKGDAIYETGTTSIEWFGDSMIMPASGSPWLGRGGQSSDSTGAGAFALYRYPGGNGSYLGFRATLVVGEGL